MSKEALNLNVLRRYDTHAEAVLATLSHVVLYTYTTGWTKLGVEGVGLIYKRKMDVGILVLNRMGLDNFMLVLDGQDDFECEGEYLILRSAKKQETFGLWVFDDQQREQVRVVLEGVYANWQVVQQEEQVKVGQNQKDARLNGLSFQAQQQQGQMSQGQISQGQISQTQTLQDQLELLGRLGQSGQIRQKDFESFGQLGQLDQYRQLHQAENMGNGFSQSYPGQMQQSTNPKTSHDTDRLLQYTGVTSASASTGNHSQNDGHFNGSAPGNFSGQNLLYKSSGSDLAKSAAAHDPHYGQLSNSTEPKSRVPSLVSSDNRSYSSTSHPGQPQSFARNAATRSDRGPDLLSLFQHGIQGISQLSQTPHHQQSEQAHLRQGALTAQGQPVFNGQVSYERAHEQSTIAGGSASQNQQIADLQRQIQQLQQTGLSVHRPPDNHTRPKSRQEQGLRPQGTPHDLDSQIQQHLKQLQAEVRGGTSLATHGAEPTYPQYVNQAVPSISNSLTSQSVFAHTAPSLIANAIRTVEAENARSTPPLHQIQQPSATSSVQLPSDDLHLQQQLNEFLSLKAQSQDSHTLPQNTKIRTSVSPPTMPEDTNSALKLDDNQSHLLRMLFGANPAQGERIKGVTHLQTSVTGPRSSRTSSGHRTPEPRPELTHRDSNTSTTHSTHEPTQQITSPAARAIDALISQKRPIVQAKAAKTSSLMQTLLDGPPLHEQRRSVTQVQPETVSKHAKRSSSQGVPQRQVLPPNPALQEALDKMASGLGVSTVAPARPIITPRLSNQNSQIHQERLVSPPTMPKAMTPIMRHDSPLPDLLQRPTAHEGPESPAIQPIRSSYQITLDISLVAGLNPADVKQALKTYLKSGHGFASCYTQYLQQTPR